MRFGNRKTGLWAGLLLGLLVILPTLAQESYPGAGLFRYQCGGSTITFFYQENLVFQVSLNEIVGPLSVAVSSGQNQVIRAGAEVSLWALHSDELQIHVNNNPDGTKLVLSSGICGPIPVGSSGTPFSAQAMAFVQLNGPGVGAAYAAVSPSGQVLAYAQLRGSGLAMAYSESSGVIPPSSSEQYHVVQPHENLFRIALRYGTTIAVLVSINRINNPALIYVGQKIYLP